MLLVQYALHLYGYVKEWRKNPKWSFSCCLALLLPLNDLQGGIRDLAGTNLLKTQLESGEFQMATTKDAIKDSGAIDVTLEEDEEGEDDTVEAQDNNRQSARNTNRKCDQGTQTELFPIFTVADAVLH